MPTAAGRRRGLSAEPPVRPGQALKAPLQQERKAGGTFARPKRAGSSSGSNRREKSASRSRSADLALAALSAGTGPQDSWLLPVPTALRHSSSPSRHDTPFTGWTPCTPAGFSVAAGRPEPTSPPADALLSALRSPSAVSPTSREPDRAAQAECTDVRVLRDASVQRAELDLLSALATQKLDEHLLALRSLAHAHLWTVDRAAVDAAAAAELRVDAPAQQLCDALREAEEKCIQLEREQVDHVQQKRDCVALRSKVSALEDENEELSRRGAEAGSAVSALRAHIDAQREVVQGLQAAVREREEMMKCVIETQQRTLQGFESDAQHSVRELEHELSQRQREVERLRRERKQLRDELQQAQAEEDASSAARAVLDKQLAHTAAQLRDIEQREAEVRAQKSFSDEAKAECEKLRRGSDQLRREAAEAQEDARKTRVQLKEVALQAEAARTAAEERDRLLEQWQGKCAGEERRLREQREELLRSTASLEEELAALRRKADDDGRARLGADAAHAQLQEFAGGMQRRIDALERRNACREQELEEAAATHSQLRTALQDAEAARDQTRRDEEEARLAVAQRDEEVARAAADLEEVRDSLAEARGRSAELLSLAERRAAEVEALRVEEGEARRRAEAAQRDAAELLGEVERQRQTARQETVRREELEARYLERGERVAQLEARLAELRTVAADCAERGRQLADVRAAKDEQQRRIEEQLVASVDLAHEKAEAVKEAEAARAAAAASAEAASVAEAAKERAEWWLRQLSAAFESTAGRWGQGSQPDAAAQFLAKASRWHKEFTRQQSPRRRPNTPAFSRNSFPASPVSPPSPPQPQPRRKSPQRAAAAPVTPASAGSTGWTGSLRQLSPPPPRRRGSPRRRSPAPRTPAAREGARVLSLAVGGPAERAGLRAADLIVSVGGRAVSNRADLRERLASLQAEQVLAVQVRRGRATLTFHVRRSAPRAGSPSPGIAAWDTVEWESPPPEDGVGFDEPASPASSTPSL